MATTLPWHPLLCPKPPRLHHTHGTPIPRRTVGPVRAFRRSDFDSFAKRMATGEVWRDVLRSTNDGFEQLVYETKKTAERIDRRFSVSRRLSAVAQSASYRAREIDRDLEITRRLRTLSLDFSQNWPRVEFAFIGCFRGTRGSPFGALEFLGLFVGAKYRKQLNDFWNTPLGRSFATLFFLWFALSGWMFRFLIFGTWILPLAGPLLIGRVANNFIIKGSCPACKKQFAGYKNQIVRCTSCGNIVWQPQGEFFSGGRKGATPSSSKSDPEVIDVEFEEK
ncbi:hypothetical protein RHSIM_Rhsim03G0219000 [Rhododendron simsii]|uniref:Uncharacterized protein n=1 Tax=Rhododendron simsii TaxID=118357 RepID=A0A834H8N5_RHOSS|nr:hypothetical protein RHSIM_Rhsim03G0219000 [Rhododendron simsii]